MDAWTTLHNKYKDQDWINKPNIFAEEAAKYFTAPGKLLDIGAGQGQDSRYFAQLGFEVTSLDILQEALDIHKSKIEDEYKDKITIVQHDLTQPLPFENESFDTIYSHLALHYFDKITTERIFNEIYRILKKNGNFAMFVNSINDPQYKTGKIIEEDYFFIDDKPKRFFSAESLRSFVSQYEPILLDEQGETYKDAAKGVHNLVRFIGKKV